MDSKRHIRKKERIPNIKVTRVANVAIKNNFLETVKF